MDTERNVAFLLDMAFFIAISFIMAVAFGVI